MLDDGVQPKDITVVTAWNVTDLGTININNEIQALVNPTNQLNEDKVVSVKIRSKNVRFKPNDIIMNTKNNYKVMTYDGYQQLKENVMLTKEDVPFSQCMNGEMGTLVDIEDGKTNKVATLMKPYKDKIYMMKNMLKDYGNF